MADSIFLGSKITADGDYSCEIQRCLLLGRKAITNIDNILKNIDRLGSPLSPVCSGLRRTSRRGGGIPHSLVWVLLTSHQ